MKLQLDSNCFVTGFATQGDIENSVEYTSEVPQGFYENCHWYKLTGASLAQDLEKRQFDESQNAALAQIEELKEFLFSTDYQAIKYAEGELDEEDYSLTKAQRKEAREQINILEGTLICAQK